MSPSSGRASSTTAWRGLIAALVLAVGAAGPAPAASAAAPLRATLRVSPPLKSLAPQRQSLAFPRSGFRIGASRVNAIDFRGGGAIVRMKISQTYPTRKVAASAKKLAATLHGTARRVRDGRWTVRVKGGLVAVLIAPEAPVALENALYGRDASLALDDEWGWRLDYDRKATKGAALKAARRFLSGVATSGRLWVGTYDPRRTAKGRPGYTAVAAAVAALQAAPTVTIDTGYQEGAATGGIPGNYRFAPGYRDYDGGPDGQVLVQDGADGYQVGEDADPVTGEPIPCVEALESTVPTLVEALGDIRMPLADAGWVVFAAPQDLGGGRVQVTGVQHGTYDRTLTVVIGADGRPTSFTTALSARRFERATFGYDAFTPRVRASLPACTPI